MIVGGYDLHLYCENIEIKKDQATDRHGHWSDEFPHQFSGANAAQAHRAAKERGWRLDFRNMKAYCPKCTRKK